MYCKVRDKPLSSQIRVMHPNYLQLSLSVLLQQPKLVPSSAQLLLGCLYGTNGPPHIPLPIGYFLLLVPELVTRLQMQGA